LRGPTLLPSEATDYEDATALLPLVSPAWGNSEKLIDFPMTAGAVRTSSILLHCDNDFEVLGRHTIVRSNAHRQGEARTLHDALEPAVETV